MRRVLMKVPQEIRTIVVDDSPVALNAICSVIAHQRPLVFVGAASNGREGLTLVRSLHPDLVLLDLEMPVMDGIEAMARLNIESPATRVVVISVHDTPGIRKLCSERGACGFVAKKSLTQELPILIRRLFEKETLRPVSTDGIK